MSENIAVEPVEVVEVVEEAPFVLLQHTALVDDDYAAALEAVPEDWVGITGAAKAVGYMAQYVRTLIRKDKIGAIKIQFGGLTKWYVDVESINARKRVGRTGTRKYVLKFDLEHEPAVRAAIAALDVDFELALAYVPKPKDEEGEEVQEMIDPDAGDEPAPVDAEEAETEFGFG